MEHFREILRLRLRHAFYGDGQPPVEVTPSNQAAFSRADLMLRRQGSDWLIVTDTTDVPDTLTLTLSTQTPDLFQVTRGANWQERPVIDAPLETDTVTLDPSPPTRGAQDPRQMTLALLQIAMSSEPRLLTVSFEAQASHWAYHVLGPGSEAAFVEDSEGKIEFDAIDQRVLPDGRTSHVLRSRQALPARARPSQRFALKSPGPFGPKTLIPVLPAPGPDFVSIAVPESSQTLVQSDIFVTILQ